MSEANWNRVLYDMSRRDRGDEEWDYDCGILLGCDNGDDDAQLEYLEE